jgi:hypothetical protein
MPAAKYNLEIDQGATYSRTITIKNYSTKTPIDITSWTFEAQIRESHEAASVIDSFTCTITDGVNGQMKIELNDTKTGDLDAKKIYVYDLEATRPDSTVLRIIEGSIIVSAEVTK